MTTTFGKNSQMNTGNAFCSKNFFIRIWIRISAVDPGPEGLRKKIRIRNIAENKLTKKIISDLRGWHQTRCRGPPSWVLNWVATPPIISPSLPDSRLRLPVLLSNISPESLLLSIMMPAFHLDFSVTMNREGRGRWFLAAAAACQLGWSGGSEIGPQQFFNYTS